MIKVILCDDHALIRRGIRDTLSDSEDIEVVGEAADYGELRALLRDKSCDVLVLDINLPGRSGLDALHALQDEGATVKVLIVSMYPEDQYAIRALRANIANLHAQATDNRRVNDEVDVELASVDLRQGLAQAGELRCSNRLRTGHGCNGGTCLVGNNVCCVGEQGANAATTRLLNERGDNSDSGR